MLDMNEMKGELSCRTRYTTLRSTQAFPRAWVFGFCSVSVFTTKTSGVQHEIQDVFAVFVGHFNLAHWPLFLFPFLYFPFPFTLHPLNPMLGIALAVVQPLTAKANVVDVQAAYHRAAEPG